MQRQIYQKKTVRTVKDSREICTNNSNVLTYNTTNTTSVAASLIATQLRMCPSSEHKLRVKTKTGNTDAFQIEAAGHANDLKPVRQP